MPKNNHNDKKMIDDVKNINATFNDIMTNITFTTDKTLINADNELLSLNDEIDNIINSEINKNEGVSSKDLSSFIMQTINDSRKGSSAIPNDPFLFENEENIFSVFNERYTNRNIWYNDLKTISEELAELNEAVLTTRDAIITSDDLSNLISRSINFGETVNVDTASQYMQIIYNAEKELKLHTSIKNYIVPHGLSYGKYYAYTCPKSDLLEHELAKRANKQRALNECMSHSLYSMDDDTQIGTFINENFTNIEEKGLANANKTYIKNCLENIFVSNDPIPIPVIEGIDITPIVSQADDALAERVKKAEKNIASKYSDAVRNKNAKYEKLNISGCYIKYLSPLQLIPINILDHNMGYYYIQHNSSETLHMGTFTNVINNTSIFNANKNVNYEMAENNFIRGLVDKIVKSFDKPYLMKNAKFKDLIYNALKYDDMYSKNISFQYIPPEYITEFVINPDEDGEGHSILEKSLFYAKLYLSLLIFKMTSIIEKSNDTRVYYVKTSGYDTDIRKRVQEVARETKRNQLNFPQLLNYPTMVNAVGKSRDMFIPVGKSSEKGIEFDVIGGQDVQLNTDFMEFLRTNMINATGVPSVIMNYVNEADYAKTLVMANSKFLGRVISLQSDFNDGITEFYKKVLKYSGADIPEEILNTLTFSFNPPRTLNINNSLDLINNADQITAYLIKSLTGENSNQSDIDNMIKDELVPFIMRDLAPSINWNRMDKLYKEALINAKKRMKEKELNSTEQ
jgi:hypothetical protein